MNKETVKYPKVAYWAGDRDSLLITQWSERLPIWVFHRDGQKRRVSSAYSSFTFVVNREFDIAQERDLE